MTFPRVSVATLLLFASTAGAQVRFTPLGDLPGGAFSSYATGVSQDGLMVVGAGKRTNSFSEEEAILWTPAGGMVGLGDLAGGLPRSVAAAISVDKRIVVGYSHGSRGTEACYWDLNDGSLRGIGDLPGGDFNSLALACSADGSSIVGVGTTQRGTRGFLWRASTGTMIDLGTLIQNAAALASDARAISADGSVIVGSATATSGGSQEAYMWTQQTGMVSLGRLPDAVNSFASDMSVDGRYVTGSCDVFTQDDGGAIMYRWSAASGMVPIDSLSDDFESGTPQGISADGRVIVGTTIPQSDGQRCFIWREGEGIVGLETYLKSIGLDVRAMGYRISSISDISDNGRFLVGTVTNPDGNGEAFLIEIPAPSAASVLTIGALLPARRRR
ncbi:MAG: hypothetical protein JNL50_01510 [Phycisphaerae bacterium]|nr:hypothetical protein [Phycisphaerae bacterium]